MCPKRTVSPPLLLRMANALIVPSCKIMICASPCDSEVHAGDSSSERSCVLYTTGGSRALCASATSAALPTILLVGVGSLHAATTIVVKNAIQVRIGPPRWEGGGKLCCGQARQDLNLQPPVLETGALPIELRTSDYWFAVPRRQSYEWFHAFGGRF